MPGFFLFVLMMFIENVIFAHHCKTLNSELLIRRSWRCRILGVLSVFAVIFFSPQRRKGRKEKHKE